MFETGLPAIVEELTGEEYHPDGTRHVLIARRKPAKSG